MRHAVIVLFVIIVVPVIAFSATLKVPSQYPNIQDAIDAAVDGDTVLVAPGAYVENIDFVGKAITVTSESGPDVTIIDGNQAGSVVIFQSGEGLNSVLDGFTITNGNTNNGGGIYCAESSPSITNNTVTENVSKEGGGIYCIKSSAIIVKNIISENEAFSTDGGGGGIYCWNSYSTIVYRAYA